MPKEQQNNPQQGKPQPTTTDAPEAPGTQENGPVRAAETPNLQPRTPVQRAMELVHVATDLFEAGQSSMVADVRKLISAAVEECPAADFPEFRIAARLRAERLKMFSEMLYNEIVAQSASVKK